MAKELQLRSYNLVYVMGFLTALCSFVASYSHVFLSQLETIIVQKDDLAPSESSFVLTVVVSASFMGEIIGPFLYKSLADRYGERGTMIRGYFVIIAAVCVQLIDLQLAFLLGSRLVLGIVVGIQASILPLYLNSLAPVSVSGKIGSMNQLLTCYGVITAYSLGFLIGQDKEDELWWRVVVGCPIVPCIISIISLTWLFPYNCIERHLEMNQTSQLQQYISRFYLNATIQDLEHQKTIHHHTSTNPTGQYRRQMQRYVLALVVVASCQLTGINAIFLYAKQLFEEITDHELLLSQQLMLGLSFCQLVACSMSGRFIDTFGRRYLMMRGQTCLIVIMVTIFLVDSCADYLPSRDFYHYTLIVLFYAHVIVFNFTLGPICILYAAELVSNLTPVIVTKRTVNLTVAISTNYLMHEFGIGPMFLLYAVMSLVVHYYLRDRLRQTKGKSKVEILQMFEISIKEGYEDDRRRLAA